jgi:sigma-70-like protein
MVLAALAMLPPRSRAVVVLRYWADLSVDQVAVILGCSPGNVRSQSARALAKLRVLLGDAGGEVRLVSMPDRRSEMGESARSEAAMTTAWPRRTSIRYRAARSADNLITAPYRA